MDKKSISSRIRSLAISTAFFLAGAYSPAVSLWWAWIEPAFYAAHPLTSWEMFKVISVYISAIAIGGILGLGVLHLIRIGQQKAVQRWPHLQKSPMILSQKQKTARRTGFVLVCILALGVGYYAFLLQPLVWVVVPGASIRVDNRPSPEAGVYTTWNGQMLAVVPSHGYLRSYVIDPIATREEAPAMCERGSQDEIFLVRMRLVQMEIEDVPDDARGCEAMPGVEVLVDPELRLQPYKMTFTSPANQHVEITFWHL